MSFRDVLLDAGVSPRDLRQAVRQARRTAENVAVGARVVEDVVARVAAKVKGKKTGAVVVLVGKAARTVREVAEETLRKR